MLFAGIDWSDQKLHFELRGGDGKAVLAEGEVCTTFAGLAELFQIWEKHAAPAEIMVAIEATQAAWIQSFLDRGYGVYALNPKNVERFRETLSAMGDKSDRIDRKVIAAYLVAFHGQLRPLRPDAPEIVALRIACEDRVRLVEEHTAKLNELQALLKAYYPAFLGFFGSLDSGIALRFLEEFPTQNQMRAIKPGKLTAWLKRNEYGHLSRLATMQAALAAPVLPVAAHLQQAKAARVVYLAGSLQALNAAIAEQEKRITTLFESLPEASIYRSLPGAGPTLAPSLLACIGRDPHRFETVGEARALMGTAPVTKQSGRTKVVFFRRGCWKFARRTLQLFAEQSRLYCQWAQEFYQRQRALGHKHHVALRALAHKWVKIIFTLKRTGRAYDEAKYLTSRQRYLTHSGGLAMT